MADHSQDDELDGVMQFSSDIADAEAPRPLPEGVYPSTIKDVKRVKRKTSGKRGLDVYFFVAPEDYPADFPVEEAPDGMTLVYRRLNLEDTKAGRFAIKRFVENVGAPPVRQQLGDEELSAWKGLSAKIVIKADEWEGNPRAVIDRIVAAA